jgi:hypothetical protein
MSTCSPRLGKRLLIAAAILLGVVITSPSVGAHAAGYGPIVVSGLSTCSNGTQSFGGCGSAGIGYCGGSLGSGQACSGPGVRTTSPGCSGTVCVPIASGGGSGLRQGQAYGAATNYASSGPGLSAPRTYVASGNYCTLGNGEKIWVATGASAASMGCPS